MVPYSMYLVIKSDSFASQHLRLIEIPAQMEWKFRLFTTKWFNAPENFIKTIFLLIYTSMNEVVELKIHNHAFGRRKTF